MLKSLTSVEVRTVMPPGVRVPEVPVVRIQPMPILSIHLYLYVYITIAFHYFSARSTAESAVDRLPSCMCVCEQRRVHRDRLSKHDAVVYRMLGSYILLVSYIVGCGPHPLLPPRLQATLRRLLVSSCASTAACLPQPSAPPSPHFCAIRGSRAAGLCL